MYNYNKNIITNETEPFFKKLGLSYKSLFLFDCNDKFNLEDEIDDSMQLKKYVIMPSIGRVSIPIEAQEVMVRCPIDEDVSFSYDKKGLSLSKERCLYFFKYHLEEKKNNIDQKKNFFDIFISFFSYEKRKWLKEKNESLTSIIDTLDILNPDMIRVVPLPSEMTTLPLIDELNDYTYYDYKDGKTYSMYIEISNIVFESDSSNYGIVVYKLVNKKDDGVVYFSARNDDHLENGYIKLADGIVFIQKTAFDKYMKSKL